MNNEDLQNEEIDEVNTPSEENEEARTDKEYSDDYLTSAIEAILFSVGESVSIDRLASALEMDKRKLTKQLPEMPNEPQSHRRQTGKRKRSK